MTDKPFFRFHPGAYEDGAFEASDDKCDACGRPCVWKYIEGVYCLPPEPIVCARCIGTGDVAKAISDGRYALHDYSFDEEPSDEIVREIERQTPGFATFNPFTWPVREGLPLAFIGYGDDKSLVKRPGVLDAIEAELGERTASPYALIFKHLAKDEYVVTGDMS